MLLINANIRLSAVFQFGIMRGSKRIHIIFARAIVAKMLIMARVVDLGRLFYFTLCEHAGTAAARVNRQVLI
jgi:hypothetical protein